MKLLSVNLARSVWLGSVSDFNPKGANLSNTLFPFLMTTYQFKKFPSYTELSDLNKGIVFEGGMFKLNNEDYPITVGITFYSDGIVAETASSTAHCDAFLVDVFNRFFEIFKIPHYDSIIRKIVYLSQVFVTTEKSLEILNPKLAQISQYLSENVEQGAMIFQCGGIIFFPDQVNKVNPATFRLERAVNIPFSENRYFSAAPLATDKHLELLEKLESILS